MNKYKVELVAANGTTLLDMRYTDTDKAIEAFEREAESMGAGQYLAIRQLDGFGVWFEPAWNMETTIRTSADL